MSVTGIESTPNPSSFLVKLSAPLTGYEKREGSLQGKSYSRVTESTPAAIAGLLSLTGVETILCLETALTINKKSNAKWEALLPLVLQTLGSTPEEEQRLLRGLASPATHATASSGQVRIRLQVSNKLPIQIEAIGFLGTIQRRRLPPKFGDHMQLLADGNVDFFAGRKWLDRGTRYVDDETPPAEGGDDELLEQSELHVVLQAECEEVDAAYSPSRLAALVAEVLGHEAPAAEPPRACSELDLESVDRYCTASERGSAEALAILVDFVSAREGSVPARRNALAFLGGRADDVDTVFDAVASALASERSPAMRRTAGDALSDLGDPRAVPYALTALLEDRSKLVQWRAARILGEMGDSVDCVAVLKQASFEAGYAFEVAFEIKDAMRKVRARLQGGGETPGTGPMWKQIQEGTRKQGGDP